MDLVQKSKQDYAALKAFSTTIPVPKDWTTKWEDNSYFSNSVKIEHHDFVLTSPDGETKLFFHSYGEGSTNFKVKDTWKTFDRRGVDSSFHWQPYYNGDEIDVAEIIKTQLERVAQFRTYAETAVTIPEIGFSVSQEALENHKKTLERGQSITFTPSGFGTGYTVYATKNPNHRYGTRRATRPLEDFFNISPLWVERFDCD